MSDHETAALPDVHAQMAGTVATLQAQVGELTAQLAAQVQARRDELAAAVSGLNARVAQIVATVQPLERLAGLPDFASEAEARLTAVEADVAGIVSRHLPTLLGMLAWFRQNAPHEVIPDPTVTHADVVVAAQQAPIVVRTM